jgi:Ni,Fe-hydrogenase III small subunit
MLSQGVDVARGGRDNTVIANRHADGAKGLWFDELKLHKGADTPDGQVVAGLVIGARKDLAPVHIDVIGVGASPYDILNGMGSISATS